jgi:hypothetical protein
VVRALAEEQAARRRRLQLGIRLAARGRVARLARGERARRRLILVAVLVHADGWGRRALRRSVRFGGGFSTTRSRLEENVPDGSWAARRGQPALGLNAADGGKLERTELGSRPDARKRSSSSVSSTTRRAGASCT